MSPSEQERLINETPQAHSVRPYRCSNPECMRMHIVLLDEHDMPIAHFVVPDAWGFTIAGVMQ
jgi:hypothetical protein